MSAQGETTKELLARIDLLTQRDPAAAERELSQLVAGRDEAADPELFGWAHYLRARLRYLEGDYDEALRGTRRARSCFLVAGKELYAVRTRIGVASVQVELGEFGVVLAQLEHLLDKLGSMRVTPEEEDDATMLRALANSVIGVACDHLGDHQRALRHLDLAANLYRVLGNDVGGAAVNLTRGIVFLNLGLHHRAQDELIEGYRAAMRHGQPLLAAECLVEVAETYAATGNLPRAMDLLRRVGDPLLSVRSPRITARWQLAMGGAQWRAGIFDQAAECASAAAETFARLAMHEQQGRAELLLGQISLGRRDLGRARDRLDLAERLFAGTGAAHMQARAWLAQARAAAWAGDDSAARGHAEKVVEALERHGDAVRAASARLMLAELTDDAATAHGHLEAVTHTAMSFGVPSLRAGLELTRARLERRAGAVDDALTRLRRLQSLPIGRHPGGDWSQLGTALLVEAMESLDELVDLLLEVGTHRSIREAWQWTAWGKARIRQQRRAASAGWVPEPLVWADQDPDQTEVVLRGMEEFDLPPHTRAYLPAPDRQEAEPLALPPVPEGTVLEYLLLGEDLVAFLIRDGQVQARRVPDGSSRSKELVSAWQLECSRVALHRSAAAGLSEENLAADVLAELYDLLIAPVLDLLDDHEDEPLAVVAHRHLHGVPFEALADPDGTRLVDRFDLHFAPELTASSSSAPAASGRPVLVVAHADDQAPMIEAEAKLVAAQWPDADLLSGDDATAARFLREAPGRSLVHVACHGVFESDNPFCSGLLLADGWLTARDILGTDLRGSTVILSSCVSGLSSEIGRVPMGLAWACLGAGAVGVVASLWQVDDAVTMELMERLHEATFRNGGDVRAALAEVSAAIAAHHPHPYFWAGFRYLASQGVEVSEVGTKKFRS